MSESGSETENEDRANEIWDRLGDEMIKFYMPIFWRTEQIAKNSNDIKAIERIGRERNRRIEKIQKELPFLSDRHLSKTVEQFMEYSDEEKENGYNRFREYLASETQPVDPLE